MDKIWYFLVFVGSKGLHHILDNNNNYVIVITKVCQLMIFTTQAASTISHFLIIKILLSNQTPFSIFLVSWKEMTHIFCKSTLKKCLSQSVSLSVRRICQMVALYCYLVVFFFFFLTSTSYPEYSRPSTHHHVERLKTL